MFVKFIREVLLKSIFSFYLGLGPAVMGPPVMGAPIYGGGMIGAPIGVGMGYPYYRK